MQCATCRLQNCSLQPYSLQPAPLQSCSLQPCNPQLATLHALALQRALGLAALQCATCRLQPCSLQPATLQLAACSLVALQPALQPAACNPGRVGGIGRRPLNFGVEAAVPSQTPKGKGGGASPPTFLTAFPGPRGRADFKNAPPKIRTDCLQVPRLIKMFRPPANAADPAAGCKLQAARLEAARLQGCRRQGAQCKAKACRVASWPTGCRAKVRY